MATDAGGNAATGAREVEGNAGICAAKVASVSNPGAGTIAGRRVRNRGAKAARIFRIARGKNRTSSPVGTTAGGGIRDRDAKPARIARGKTRTPSW
jgi:hypothetical protein